MNFPEKHWINSVTLGYMEGLLFHMDGWRDKKDSYFSGKERGMVGRRIGASVGEGKEKKRIFHWEEREKREREGGEDGELMFHYE